MTVDVPHISYHETRGAFGPVVVFPGSHDAAFLPAFYDEAECARMVEEMKAAYRRDVEQERARS